MLVEPFVGAGSVFLNTDFDAYLLADINRSNQSICNFIKSEPDTFIRVAGGLFDERNNQRERYFQLRDEFNQTTDKEWRAALFLYLNRRGYNGLCRYNRKGGFNVFGRYKNRIFLRLNCRWLLLRKHRKPHLYASRLWKRLPCWSRITWCIVIRLMCRCRPRHYAAKGFSENEQRHLAELAWQAASEKQISVLISNHATQLTYDLYKHAALHELQVKRTISRAGHTRQRVSEFDCTL